MKNSQRWEKDGWGKPIMDWNRLLGTAIFAMVVAASVVGVFYLVEYIAIESAKYIYTPYRGF